jgi:nitroimidazol reductase NimA-like FMN-containing flavoprotein (pyridoxamine 5'-phosphate oxidase superfamily)
MSGVEGAPFDPAVIGRLLAANRYLVLGTADDNGSPWVSPVFFAPHGQDGLVWVSSPDSRHSRNIAARSAVAITVFDSTVEVGHAEAAYFDAEAAEATPDQTESALRSLNARLPQAKQLGLDDIRPRGPMAVYRAEVRRRYLLVRGGNRQFGNALDMTLEI